MNDDEYIMNEETIKIECPHCGASQTERIMVPVNESCCFYALVCFHCHKTIPIQWSNDGKICVL